MTDVQPKQEKKKGPAKFETADQSSSQSTAQPIIEVPAGQMKDFSQPMADAYYPSQVERSWDDWWYERGLYKPKSDSESNNQSSTQSTDESVDQSPFVIVIPPPNVTGTLHLGHALTVSIEDSIVRYHRMTGRDVLWVPGTDHAGIATQVVVEKKLFKDQGITRHDLGRDQFVEQVWKWKEANGSRINQQIRRLGASVDWSREAFTMDDQRSKAVEECFLILRSRGLIYRSNRLVNWSCTLRTAISSIEVEHVDLTGPTLLKVPGYDDQVEFGVIHSFAYKLSDSDDEIVVATTRIETMLGDVAVAVHPDDVRYQKYHGKTLKHPFVADRTVTIVTDSTLVDMNFGTGAVKVTPAHDPNDFACGQRNKLQMINIFTDEGMVNEHGGQFAGQKRFDARKNVISELERLGLYRGKASNPMSLGVCSRSKDIIEPVLRPQWWVNCQTMAARAVEKVRGGDLKIVPKEFDKVWYSWLENIQDWCISRQLWWGHRIPAYYVSVPSDPSFAQQEENELWVTGRSIEQAREAAAAKWSHIAADKFELRQDEDVLDTWFSSGLFPFATMGWPNKTSDLEKFFPGTLLETGHDILFFWVARMVMLSLELTDQLPFTTVYLHAMVRDKLGRKMSKSLGNVVDPIDVINGISLEDLTAKLLTGNLDPREVVKATEGQKQDFPNGISECGADALRFGLLAYSAQGRDINLDIQRVVAYRQFGNKLWNATKFALMNFDASFVKPASWKAVVDEVNTNSRFIGDRWILSRLSAAVTRANAGFKDYQFAECTTACYNFWLYDFCDVYLELVKPIVRDTSSPEAIKQKQISLTVLFTCLEQGLILLHPMMPFITEELYHRLPQMLDTEEKRTGTGSRLECGSIMVAQYPRVQDWSSVSQPEVESLMSTLQEISKNVRNTRINVGLGRGDLELFILCSTEEWCNRLNTNQRDIATMAGASKVQAVTDKSVIPEGCASCVVSDEIQLFVPLAGKVDFSAELIKMEKSLQTLKDSIAAQQAKMTGPGWEKLKPEMQTKMSTKLASDQAEADKITASINAFYGLMTETDKQQYREQKRKSLQTEIERITISMTKFLPAGKEVSELPKKVAGKYAELKTELQRNKDELEKVGA